MEVVNLYGLFPGISCVMGKEWVLQQEAFLAWDVGPSSETQGPGRRIVPMGGTYSPGKASWRKKLS